jgi:hypothetical protein
MCDTCKEINEFHVLSNPKYNYEYSVKITRDCYVKEQFRGTILGERHMLNFCPECGKRLGDD